MEATVESYMILLGEAEVCLWHYSAHIISYFMHAHKQVPSEYIALAEGREFGCSAVYQVMFYRGKWKEQLVCALLQLRCRAG